MRKAQVTILTGFLGSGKTTVLNHLLTQELGRGSAVIVNEFGEVGIDAQLVVGVDEDILEINNGCICCTVRQDLVATIGRLLARPEPVERILVETTGLADPAPIIQSFILDETLRDKVELDALVTVVDARHNAHWLALGEDDAAEGRENTAAEQIAFADLILLNKVDLVDANGLVDCEADLRRRAPLARVIRVENGAIPAESVLGVGAFDLANALRLEPSLLSDLEHGHDETITSVVVRVEGALDGDRFFRWLNRYVGDKGRENLRIKGIVALAGERRRYVFHGVHMTLDGRPGRPWQPDEPRDGEIVFIGRHLSRGLLESGVRGCLSDALAA